jgi:hypothetical protein
MWWLAVVLNASTSTKNDDPSATSRDRWGEADRVSIGLSARDSETARDEEHGHGKPPPFELIDETKSALPQCLWRE